MRLINLTPHEVVLYSRDGESIIKSFPSECNTFGTPKVEYNHLIDPFKSQTLGVPIVDRIYTGHIEGLPSPSTDIVYIVSSLVLEAAIDRSDLIAPNTDPSSVIRDEKGRIIGVTSFVS